MGSHGPAGRRAWRLVAPLVMLAFGGAAAQPEPVVHEVVAERSHVLVVTRRAGTLGFLGHEHAVLGLIDAARICFAPGHPESASVRIVVATASLVIDTDEALRAAGLSSRPDAETVAELQERMLGPEFLDAERFPELRFASRRVSATPEGGLLAEGRLTLHGRTRPLEVPIEVSDGAEGAVRFVARTRARMTSFGIEPERNLGLVDVADEFDLVVDVTARPTAEPCVDPAPGRGDRGRGGGSR